MIGISMFQNVPSAHTCNATLNWLNLCIAIIILGPVAALRPCIWRLAIGDSEEQTHCSVASDKLFWPLTKMPWTHCEFCHYQISSNAEQFCAVGTNKLIPEASASLCLLSIKYSVSSVFWKSSVMMCTCTAVRIQNDLQNLQSCQPNLCFFLLFQTSWLIWSSRSGRAQYVLKVVRIIDGSRNIKITILGSLANPFPDLQRQKQINCTRSVFTCTYMHRGCIYCEVNRSWDADQTTTDMHVTTPLVGSHYPSKGQCKHWTQFEFMLNFVQTLTQAISHACKQSMQRNCSCICGMQDECFSAYILNRLDIHFCHLLFVFLEEQALCHEDCDGAVATTCSWYKAVLDLFGGSSCIAGSFPPLGLQFLAHHVDTDQYWPAKVDNL